MSAHDSTTSSRLRGTGQTAKDDGADQLRVRLAAPPLGGVLRIVLILVVAALALYLVWRLRGVIQLLAISLFFAFALFPVVEAVAVRTRAPRALVILAVYLVLATLVVLIGYVVIPSLVKEVQAFSRNAPAMRRISVTTRRLGTTTTAITSPRSSSMMPNGCHRSWRTWQGLSKM